MTLANSHDSQQRPLGHLGIYTHAQSNNSVQTHTRTDTNNRGPAVTGPVALSASEGVGGGVCGLFPVRNPLYVCAHRCL